MFNKIVALVKSPENVIPAQAGIYNCMKLLDSAIKSRNDKWEISTLYEFIRINTYLLKILLYLLIAGSVIAAAGLCEGAEEPDADIIAIGSGVVINENLASARNDAISDALTKGMEDYLKHTLGLQVMVNNFEVIINEIIPNYREGIVNFNILSESRYKNRYKILASVKINEKQMEEKLRDYGILIIEGLPVRLLFLVSQKIHPEEEIFWWNDPIANNQLYMTELILHRIFQERGMRPVNRLSSVPEDYSDEIRQLSLTPEDISQWGRFYSANVVISGRVETTSEGVTSLEISAIDVERGMLIGRHSETLIPDEPVDDMSKTGQLNIYEKALNNAVNALTPYIVTAFKDEQLIKNTFKIRLTGLDTFRQLKLFTEFLVSDVKGVESVVQSRISGDILTIDAEFTGTIDLLITRMKESLRFPFPADVRISEEGVISVGLKKRILNDNP